MLRIELPRVFNSCSASSPDRLIRTVLLAVVTLLAGCNDEALYSMLDETQANDVQAALLRAEIPARKVAAKDGEHWAVTVGRANIPAAMAALHELGLPRDKKQSIGQVFEKKGFVSSPLEERARYLYALSQELAGTLMEIDGVVSSRVHVALPEERVLEDNPQSASVSVVLVQEPGVDLTPYETDIKAIVTDGIEGLDDVNRVTVKFFSRRKSEPLPVIQQTTAGLTLEWWMVWGTGGGVLLLLLISVLATFWLSRSSKAGKSLATVER